MQERMSDKPQTNSAPAARIIEPIGEWTLRRIRSAAGFIEFVGSLALLTGQTVAWIFRAVTQTDVRIGRDNLLSQMVRVGVRSIPIIGLVQVFIGIILALQMAPTLKNYGQIQRTADIVGIAMFRELGPLLSGIVLSGFAGASIAAELGTMVEGEEIKALRAAALNPIRFLVVPRFLATTIMLTMLTVIADTIGVFGGFLTAVGILGISADQYISSTQAALTMKDYLSGLCKAPLFGLLISMIACYEGLSVSGGAEGVGRATTNTVVKCIVALISADVVVTILLYSFGV
jgi:phospholipid/cholesterol/gamma-HCH transport system permease protein